MECDYGSSSITSFDNKLKLDENKEYSTVDIKHRLLMTSSMKPLLEMTG